MNNEFSPRVTYALEQSPINGILYHKGKLTNLYLSGIEIVNKICREKGICKHDLEHIIRVGENVFILQDGFSHARPETKEEMIFSDSFPTLGALIHDLGYLSKGLGWEGLEATFHPEKGARLLKGIRRYLLPKWLKQNPSVEAQRSLEIIDTYEHVIKSMISITTEKAIQKINEKRQTGNISWESTLPVVVKLADCLDYFRSNRVKDITAPSTYQENPYYFLCRAVSDYSLEFNRKNMEFVYSAQLEPEADFMWWEKEVQANYGDIWKLAESYSQMLGITFVRQIEFTG